MSFRERFAAAGHTVGRGRLAEEEAVRWLAEHGYRLVETNVRTSYGEIDVVAWSGDTLCFLEIKARSSQGYGGGLEAVDARKQRRLARAASAYLARLRHTPACRFDVLALEQEGERWAYRLVTDAFRLPD